MDEFEDPSRRRLSVRSPSILHLILRSVRLELPVWPRVGKRGGSNEEDRQRGFAMTSWKGGSSKAWMWNVKWHEEEGRKLLDRAKQKQMQALQWLAVVLEQAVPEKEASFGEARKAIARALQDLGMRGAWSYEHDAQEWLLQGATYSKRLVDLVDVMIKYGKKKTQLRTSCRIAECKPEVSDGSGGFSRKNLGLNDPHVSLEMTPAWLPCELIAATEKHLPELSIQLGHFKSCQDEAMQCLCMAIHELITAKQCAKIWWDERRLDQLIHSAVDRLCRTLVLCCGFDPDRLGWELKLLASYKVRSRVLNRLYFFLEEVSTLFREAAEREIEKREEQRRRKAEEEEKKRQADLGKPSSTCEGVFCKEQGTPPSQNTDVEDRSKATNPGWSEGCP
eukprot:s545_g4.t1